MAKPPKSIQQPTRQLSKSISGESVDTRQLSGEKINISQSGSSSHGSFISDFETVKEGMLGKKAQTHILRGWQHRYFKLEKDSLNNYVLRYFADEAEAKGKNLARKDKSLDKLLKIQKVDNTLEFNLVFEGERSNLHLKAKNREEYKEWTDLLYKTKGIGFLSSPTK